MLLPARVRAAFDEEKVTAIRAAMDAAITDRTIPGGVVWMERGKTSVCEAFGNRMIDPRTAPMKADTIFDSASLTKVLATAPSVMLLVQEGKFSLQTPVSTLIPDFTAGGKETVTVYQLLTHTSGTRSGIPRERVWSGYKEGVAAAAAEPLLNPPGAKFLYSDINFILLGEIVRRISGIMISDFAAGRIFRPLGMKDTGYQPSRSKLDRIAPTSREGDTLVHGVVHDPTCRRMGGVAGHAGVFTTAKDIAIFCRMMLNGGATPSGQKILHPATLPLMIKPLALPGGIQRALGWDIQSTYTDIKGPGFSAASYSHTGWTGTAFLIDPVTSAFVILLTNRNHPADITSLRTLRFQVGTFAAEAMRVSKRKVSVTPRRALRCRVKNGVDVLVSDGFAQLRGLKVGLITNHTGLTQEGVTTIDALAGARDPKLVCLFSPEHGIRGEEDRDGIADTTDAKTGLPVYSLYGKTRRPMPAQLKEIDTLVFDIQDAGCRFYTYVSTMLECMKAASAAGKRFIVLDRVNPINGNTIDGPLPVGALTFVACHRIPLRHGMTAGELARLFVAELMLKLDLAVITVEGWDRSHDLAAAGLEWVNPSPNMRSLDAATLYPGVALVEFCNVSVGRGTGSPFQFIGAPWVDAEKLAAALVDERLPGLKIEPASVTPHASVFKGEQCRGIRLSVKDRAKVDSVRTGVAVATALQRLHKGTFKLEPVSKLLLEPKVQASIAAGASVSETVNLYSGAAEEFRRRRAPFLIYPPK